MKTRFIFILALSIATALALDACVSSPATVEETLIVKTPITSPLEDTQWDLGSYINAQGQLADVLPETQGTLEFNDGKLSGSAGCNSYFGDYQSGETTPLAPSAYGDVCKP
jgi:heat shock protein HslJ